MLMRQGYITKVDEDDGCQWIMKVFDTFPLKKQFFTIFGLTLGPDVKIFSQFQEMRL